MTLGCFASNLRRTFRQANLAGFTLIEVMICICIIGVLSSIATPMYLSYRERARVIVAVADIKTIELAVSEFSINNGELPNSLADIGRSEMLDPWGNPYQYLRIAGGETKGKGKMRKDHFMVPVNSDFDLYSMGRDGASVSPFTAKASQDDIVRAYNGGYFGLVSEI